MNLRRIPNSSLIDWEKLDNLPDNINSELDLKQNTSEKWQANWYASLDWSWKVPTSQLPPSIAWWDMLKSENLSWLANYATARTNLWLNTTANQTDSTDKRFMTDAQVTNLNNQSWVNTGNQTMSNGTPITATQWQKVCTAPTYVIWNNKLEVYLNWILQEITQDYTETSTTSITFVTWLLAWDRVTYKLLS